MASRLIEMRIRRENNIKSSKIIINQIDSFHKRILGQELKHAASESKIVIPLHPYSEYANSEYIKEYINEGQCVINYEDQCIVSSN